MMKNLLTKSIFISLLSGVMVLGYEISDYDSVRDSADVFDMKMRRNKQLKITENYFSRLFLGFFLLYPIFFRMMQMEGFKVLRVSGKVIAWVWYFAGEKDKVIVIMEVAYSGKEKKQIETSMLSELVINTIDALKDKNKSLDSIGFEVYDEDGNTKELLRKMGFFDFGVGRNQKVGDKYRRWIIHKTRYESF